MSPTEVVHAYDRAVYERRWDDAVALMHPGALTYHVHQTWHRMLDDEAARLGDDRATLSDAEIAARFIRATDPRTRYDEWVEATIKRYPEHEAEIRRQRQSPKDVQHLAHPDFVGHLVDGDTAYVVLPAWESPRGETSEFWKGLRISPTPPIVLRRHEGRWKIASDLTIWGVYVAFRPIEVSVGGKTLQLQPHGDEAS